MRFQMIPPHHPSGIALAEAGEVHRCPNCGAGVRARFCGDCGQSRHDHSRSMLEVVHELIAHHLFLDGKMMMTLVALLLRPGLLTRAFIEGRRVRFVSPIRLYLFASFAFFLALWISGFAMIQFHIPRQAVEFLSNQDQGKDGAAEPAHYDGSDGPVIEILRPARDGEALPDAIKAQLKLQEDIETAKEHSADDAKTLAFLQRVVDGFTVALAHPRALNPVLDEWLPRLLIITLPFTALLLALFGRKRGLYFVDHVTFALHLQAFLFTTGLIVILVRVLWPGLALGWSLFAIFSLYGYIAYLRTYPGNWLWAAFKLGIISSTYCIALAIGLVALLVYGVSTLPAV
jgi:hypothetical protein